MNVLVASLSTVLDNMEWEFVRPAGNPLKLYRFLNCTLEMED
jgi:hypothetical protein